MTALFKPHRCAREDRVGVASKGERCLVQFASCPSSRFPFGQVLATCGRLIHEGFYSIALWSGDRSEEFSPIPLFYRLGFFTSFQPRSVAIP